MCCRVSSERPSGTEIDSNQSLYRTLRFSSEQTLCDQSHKCLDYQLLRHDKGRVSDFGKNKGLKFDKQGNSNGDYLKLHGTTKATDWTKGGGFFPGPGRNICAVSAMDLGPFAGRFCTFVHPAIRILWSLPAQNRLIAMLCEQNQVAFSGLFGKTFPPDQKEITVLGLLMSEYYKDCFSTAFNRGRILI